LAPLCGGSDAEELSTPAVRVHGAAVEASNPPLTIRFVVPPAGFTVKLTVVVWVKVPEVPVTVTVDVPVVAVALAVKVKTLVPVVGLVPKVAVTPEGRVEVANVTLPVKPPEGVSVMVLLPLPPWATVTLVGEAESEKSGVATALMVREIEVVWVSVPEVPVIVIVLVPVVAVLLAVKVNTLVPVVGLVPKVAVTPDGRAEVDKLTDPVKPPEGVTVIVLFPLVPCVTFKLVGEADSEKLGVGLAGKLTQLFAALENSN
jgi:hypothetical protein